MKIKTLSPVVALLIVSTTFSVIAAPPPKAIEPCVPIPVTDFEYLKSKPWHTRLHSQNPTGDGILVDTKSCSGGWPWLLIRRADHGVWNFSEANFFCFEVVNPMPVKQVEAGVMINRKYHATFVVNPGETRTVRIRINHALVDFDPLFKGYAMFRGHKSGRNSDMTKVKSLGLILSTPFQMNFEMKNFRLEGRYVPNPAYVDESKFFPLIDKYGQNRHEDWPEKIRKDEDLIAAKEAEEKKFRPKVAEWNKYGGWANGPSLKATGWFYPTKYQGKWWLVDPEGKLFFSRGIVAVTLNENVWKAEGREKLFEVVPNSPDKTRNFAVENCKLKYGNDLSVYADVVEKRFDSWGFNTYGNWSYSKFTSRKKIPYTFNVMFKGALSGHWGMPDPYSEKFQKWKDRIFEQDALKQRMNDPWCLGIYVANELMFLGNQYALHVMRSRPHQEAKIRMTNYLKEKYKTIGALNKMWETTYKTFDVMLNSHVQDNTYKMPKTAKDDFDEFSAMICDKLYKDLRYAIKKANPNMLFLGTRLMAHDYFSPKGDIIGPVAAKYADVVSHNNYQLSFDRFKAAGIVDKPILITETSVGHSERGLWGSLVNVDAIPGAREEVLFKQMSSALKHPDIVGVHYFLYVDQPMIGRNYDNENFGFGLIDVTDTPYQDFCDAQRKVSEQMYLFRTTAKGAQQLKR